MSQAGSQVAGRRSQDERSQDERSRVAGGRSQEAGGGCDLTRDLRPATCDLRQIVLIGNANVGKSLLFSRLTKRHATVSNYPGTTVEVTSASSDIGVIVDTPGVNSLLPQSSDEIVARDLLLERKANAIVVQVGDIANLRRTVLLTLQLAELDVPLVVCLNMADELHSGDASVNASALTREIGSAVVAVSALRRWNIGRLRDSIACAVRPTATVAYSPAIENAVRRLLEILPADLRCRGIALSIVAGDASLRPLLSAGITAACDEVRESVPQPASIAIANARVAAADALIARANSASTRRGSSVRDRLGALCMHPLWGLPILGLVLAFAWYLVGRIGAGVLVDWMQTVVFGKYINPNATRLLDALHPPRFVHELLVGQYGVLTMALTYAIAIVLPVVITFFTFFGILEDTGYLPRLAVLLHRAFRRIGLNGKAVLPMVLGLGCDTMATLTTRILDSKKESTIVTLLLALGVPCSAQLGVIVAMLSPLGAPAAIIWSFMTLGTIGLVGWAAARVVPGDPADFVLEIPPMRIPSVANIAVKVAARAEWYLKEAVPLFVIGTLLLFVLDWINALTLIQRGLSPLIVNLLGLPAEATNAFVIGFLRRDYGAAGLFAMQRAGHLTPNQVVIALTVITLFIPCIANLLVMLKERGARAGWTIAGFIIVYSFGVGAAMNAAFRILGVRL
jgi:ferrous iron transport protein B